MALSLEDKKKLRIALGARGTSDNVADLIADMIDSGANPQGAAVTDIADPGTATTTDIANKVNELLASLRAAGIIAS